MIKGNNKFKIYLQTSSSKVADSEEPNNTVSKIKLTPKGISSFNSYENGELKKILLSSYTDKSKRIQEILKLFNSQKKEKIKLA
jgi:hypothetical protein